MASFRIIHAVVVLLLITSWDSVLACPFSRRRTTATGNQTAIVKTSHFSLRTRRTGTCAKTAFSAVTPSKESICSAFTATNASFMQLLRAKADPKSAIFGSVIRLAFHDAGEADVSKIDDHLGPDGCLSNDRGSAGLVEPNSIVQVYVEPLYQAVCDRISRADFWVLLAKLVLEQAIVPALPVPYQYGRRDNVECEGGAGRLPQPDRGLEEFHRVFVRQMGLTMADAVTLIGAHSLGHTHIEASGYGFRSADTTDEDLLNAWDNTPAALDHDYYVKLRDLKWRSLPTVSNRSTQWQHNNDPFVMTNADMAIAYPLDTAFPGSDPHGRAQLCHVGRHDHSPKCKRPRNVTEVDTWQLCLDYSLDNRRFQTEFVRAFTRMTCVGYGVPGPNEGDSSTGKLGTLTTVDLSTC